MDEIAGRPCCCGRDRGFCRFCRFRSSGSAAKITPARQRVYVRLWDFCHLSGEVQESFSSCSPAVRTSRTRTSGGGSISRGRSKPGSRSAASREGPEIFENPADIRGDGAGGLRKVCCPSFTPTPSKPPETRAEWAWGPLGRRLRLRTPPPDFQKQPRVRWLEPWGFAQGRS